MRRGTALEPAARAAYEALTGHVMQPLVLVDGEYSASLDGITLAGDLILEIKCPMKGRDRSCGSRSQRGPARSTTRWQIQHQLMVAGREARAPVRLRRQARVAAGSRARPACWTRSQKAWDAFMQPIETDTPPPLTSGTRWSDRGLAGKPPKPISRRSAQPRRRRSLEAARRHSWAYESTRANRVRCPGDTVLEGWERRLQEDPGLKKVDVEEYRGTGRYEIRVNVGGKVGEIGSLELEVPFFCVGGVRWGNVGQGARKEPCVGQLKITVACA